MDWGRVTTVPGLFLFVGGLITTLNCFTTALDPRSACIDDALLMIVEALLFTRN
jgi:hypothetical protein